MTSSHPWRRSILWQQAFLLAAFLTSHPRPAAADQLHAAAGAQSRDQGRQALAFLPNEVWIHEGDSVTWAFPTAERHTVTFLRATQPRPKFQVGCPGTTPDGSSYDGSSCGTEPADPFAPPSSSVTPDADGALLAVVASPADSVHSGLFGPAPGERTGVPQAPLGVTRFRVTFTAPGTFRYICALHDEQGMVGTVVVRP